MGFPKMYDDVHLPFLHLVHKYPIKSVKEAVGILAHYFNLTNEELNERVNCGRKKFYSMVSFSLKRLMDAGLVFREVKPFRATDKARKLLARKPNKITNHDLNVLIKRKLVLDVFCSLYIELKVMICSKPTKKRSKILKRNSMSN
ncbi:winged helix-turn-helix domain-containing protein [Bacillus thuringiensis]|uniref:winged helix-turn-helix domain-containing protein n=1 Tax=Bacillus thuringiensis TaxID=1428 RepID=UPI000BFC0DA8|nr:winged helix-turn-helix domain-containing protein [Bacillus thuringiensis]PGS85281.1 hypothetical protein COD02_10180 [Bacillus thuringiensis]PGT87510.1 hypothetical protein COD17_15645 [Bacillus thuringiensis]